MDSVRLGRVLGMGARMAAKTLVGAVDAATSPNPATATSPNPAPAKAPAAPAKEPLPRTLEAGRADAGDGTAGATVRRGAAGAGARAARATVQARETGKGLRRGTQRFGEAVWGPTVRLSGVLWLEVTGVFFGLFALSAAVGAWKIHEGGMGAGGRSHMLVAGGLAAVFGYFCVSSFARARRRERGR